MTKLLSFVFNLLIILVSQDKKPKLETVIKN